MVCDWSRGFTTLDCALRHAKFSVPSSTRPPKTSPKQPHQFNQPWRRTSPVRLVNLTLRYAQVAARNSEQTAEEASAPVPVSVIPNESIISDVASYSTTSGDDTSSLTSAPGGVHIINRSELSELDTSDEQVISDSGPSITVNQPIVDETQEVEDTKDDVESAANGIKKKLSGHKKFSAKDKEVAVYGSFGTLNLLALGAVGYWSWKRYTGGETAWKVIGIAAGAYAGFAACEWIGVRYVFFQRN